MNIDQLRTALEKSGLSIYAAKQKKRHRLLTPKRIFRGEVSPTMKTVTKIEKNPMKAIELLKGT